MGSANNKTKKEDLNKMPVASLKQDGGADMNMQSENKQVAQIQNNDSQTQKVILTTSPPRAGNNSNTDLQQNKNITTIPQQIKRTNSSNSNSKVSPKKTLKESLPSQESIKQTSIQQKSVSPDKLKKENPQKQQSAQSERTSNLMISNSAHKNNSNYFISSLSPPLNKSCTTNNVANARNFYSKKRQANSSCTSPQQQTENRQKIIDQSKLKAILKESSIKPMYPHQQQDKKTPYSQSVSQPVIEVSNDSKVNNNKVKENNQGNSAIQSDILYTLQQAKSNQMVIKNRSISEADAKNQNEKNPLMNLSNEQISQNLKSKVEDEQSQEQRNTRQQLKFLSQTYGRTHESDLHIEKRRKLLKQQKHYEEIAEIFEKNCSKMNLKRKKSEVYKVLPYLEQPIELSVTVPIKKQKTKKQIKSERGPDFENFPMKNSCLESLISNINIHPKNEENFQSSVTQESIYPIPNTEQKELWNPIQQNERYWLEEENFDSQTSPPPPQSRIRIRKYKNFTKTGVLSALDVKKIFESANNMRISQKEGKFQNMKANTIKISSFMECQPFSKIYSQQQRAQSQHDHRISQSMQECRKSNLSESIPSKISNANGNIDYTKRRGSVQDSKNSSDRYESNRQSLQERRITPSSLILSSSQQMKPKNLQKIAK